MFVKNVMINLKKYSFLLQQLVSRDFKVKYKRISIRNSMELIIPNINNDSNGNSIFKCV